MIGSHISDFFVSIRQALRIFVDSAGFIVELVDYLPAVIASGVLIFLASYIVRFWFGR